MQNLYQKLKTHGSAAAFILGFIWDNIMLRRIDHGFANLMLGTYLTLSFFIIIALNMHSVRRRRLREQGKNARWLPLIIQFCFGSLFSAYIIFYTRSASIFVNWPFLLLLVALVFANEFFRHRYVSPVFQLGTFFTVLFSYVIFSLPIVLGRIGGDVFILSGLASLAGITLLSFLVRLADREEHSKNRLLLVAVIAGIYALFNVAYFTGIIPPVPLALKEIGVYHSVLKNNDGSYTVSFEPGYWYPLSNDASGTFDRRANEPVYVFSSVFAPTKITAPIFHSWSYFDEIDKVWVTTDRIQFPLSGGREDGFREFSMKSGVFPAQWRVDVETEGKKLIGRVEFQIVDAKTPVTNLVTDTR